MNEFRRRMNVLSSARRPDFSRYPSWLKTSLHLRAPHNGDGWKVMRLICPEDEPAMRRFHARLSEETVYQRYFEHFSLEGRIDHERLAKVCANTPDSIALVIESGEGPGRDPEIQAVGRLTTTDEPFVASFAILVRDDRQGHGLDAHLLRRLIVLARAFGFKLLVDDDLVSNHDMLNLCKKFGFTLHTLPDEGIVRVCLAL